MRFSMLAEWLCMCSLNFPLIIMDTDAEFNMLHMVFAIIPQMRKPAQKSVTQLGIDHNASKIIN